MITVVTSIWAMPLILVIGMINMFLFMAAMRFALSRLDATKHSLFCEALSQCVDPAAEHFRNWISCRLRKHVSLLSGWIVLACVILIVRHSLLKVIVWLA